MPRKRHERDARFGSGAVAGRGAAEGEPSAFEREASGVSRSEPEHAHVPVLADEVTFLLRPRRGGWVVDGTVGMGGHAEQLLERGGGDTRLLGIDRDPEALAR
ncbi:MAG TPA: 16S rRNA (cytosine(1402)-N(4))-methyltransferase, partial [Methylomirabilota bacterium]|nr:16S rRNA (cytosine(1402)-N(4))-methyltransferase [Methylomirabilota bacterium]